MTQTRNWQEWKDMAARLLKERTGADVKTWNRRINKEKPGDKKTLRKWLDERGVTGYSKSMLIMEKFGYPDWLVASSGELVNGQYADRPQLRPIFDAIIDMTTEVGEVIIQTRKTYVSLVSPRRTFARVQPTTKNRIDLLFRLEGQKPGRRLKPSKYHENLPFQISLTSRDEVDSDLRNWLQLAYDQNC